MPRDLWMGVDCAFGIGVASDTDALQAALADISLDDNILTEIVFLDSAIGDLDTSIAVIDPSIEIIIIDANRDGLEQIAQAMDGRSGVDASTL